MGFLPLLNIGLLYVFHTQVHACHIIRFVNHKEQGKGNHVYPDQNRYRIAYAFLNISKHQARTPLARFLRR